MSDFLARNGTLSDPRRTYRLTPDQARELAIICAQGEDDPRGHRDRVNTWWAARAAEQGFRWTTISALAVGEIGGEPAEVTFTAEHEPAGDAHPFSPVGADAIVLLAEARNLFRRYEQQHLAKIEPMERDASTAPGAIGTTIAKAYRNADIAVRIEAFLANPASSALAHDGLREAREGARNGHPDTPGEREMVLGDLYAGSVFHRQRPRAEIEARMTGRASDVPDRFYRSPPAEGLECPNDCRPVDRQ